MPIVNLQPDAVPEIVTTAPTEIEAPKDSIFTALVPDSKVNSLLKYVEGFPWTVDFYGQILNKNNTLENFDPSTPNLTQPYYKVVKMILQVSSPLNSSYDNSKGVTTVSGTAVTPYKIIPNVGDVFIAQTDTGEDAIFHITSVSRKTYRKDTLYEISYSIYAYVSDNPTFIATLANRINETYYFNSDTDYFNRDVLLKASVVEAKDRLRTFVNESQDYYIQLFSQFKTGSILIPGIDSVIYDPLLVNFVSKIVPYTKLVDVQFYRHTYFNRFIDQPSIFNALINRSLNTLYTANKTYSFLDTSFTNNRARFGSVLYTGIDYIVFPTNPDVSTSIGLDSPYESGGFRDTIKTTLNYSSSLDLVVETTNNNNVFTKKLLHELFVNDSYVVSENFYNYLSDNTKYNDISYIELLIARYLRREAIAKEDLVVGIQDYYQWSLLHKLYLLPVCWLIINAY